MNQVYARLILVIIGCYILNRSYLISLTKQIKERYSPLHIYNCNPKFLLGRDNSSHNLTVAHSCRYGTLVGSGPQTHGSRALTCTYTW